MPMHDWKLVHAGIFHAFHHRWISAISDALNAGLLPSDYYALPERQAAGFGPDVLTLPGQGGSPGDESIEAGKLERDGYVAIPLELTHHTAFNVQPLKWRKVLEPPASNRPETGTTPL
jgi:hypothetical protein